MDATNLSNYALIEELERIVKAMPEEVCSDILSALKERGIL